MKRVLAYVICLTVVLCSAFSAAAATDSTMPEDAIRTDLVSAFADAANISIDDASAVSITNSYVRVDKEGPDGNPEIYYIVGIGKADDGGLHTINPNLLVKEIVERGSYQQTVEYKHLVFTSRIYMTVTYTVTYSQYNGTASSCIYRPSGLSAYWTPGSYTPSITVSDFNVYYDSTGELVQFPACNTATNLFSLVVTSDYSHTISIYKSNPSSGTTYSSYSSLPSNRALWFANSVLHGSTVSFDIYTSQGRYNDTVDLGISY